MNICVVGAGSIGLATAIMAAYLNHLVVIVDDDQSKINLLKNNSLYFYEPYLNDLLKIVSKNLYFTSNLTNALEHCDVVYFTGEVGFDLKETSEIYCNTNKTNFKLLINKSPSSLGDTKKADYLLKDKNKNYHAVYEIPYLNPTTIVTDLFYPAKIVLGIENDEAKRFMFNFYKPIIDKKIEIPDIISLPHRPDVELTITDISSAELAYHAEKVFNGLKSSFANEINNLSVQNNAITEEVLKIIQTSGMNGFDYNFGLGWSRKEYGESFEYLNETAQSMNLDVPVIDSALRSNYNQRDILIHKLEKILNGFKNKTIGILGLTYKAYTDDLTDSPAIDLIRVLLEHDVNIKVHDPVVNMKMSIQYPNLNVQYCDDVLEVFDKVDIVVLCCEWTEYFELDWDELSTYMKTPNVFDARGCLLTDIMSSKLRVYNYGSLI